MAPRLVRIGLRICAALLVTSGANHARLALGGVGDVSRHAVFVALNLALAALLFAKPRRALFPTLALAVQQGFSHGSDLLASARGPGRLDWASLGVLVFFPLLLALLVMDRRAQP